MVAFVVFVYVVIYLLSLIFLFVFVPSVVVVVISIGVVTLTFLLTQVSEPPFKCYFHMVLNVGEATDLMRPSHGSLETWP